MTTLLAIVLLGFFAAGIVGWLWIVVLAFRDGEALWGIGCLAILPLSIVYGLEHPILSTLPNPFEKKAKKKKGVVSGTFEVTRLNA